ncbi:Oxidation resistance protein 1 [Phytophthora cinnamomi]|uniref:Oxidation resistance protein 1 n=1 Tax=Phytophthora cinnamomi TaxID=4785 RepID=UPI003559F121|nr:Oxidation resistance protein 1 [Phytophthora cinnamomi]
MLGKISHWLATRHEDKGGAGDAFVQQRYDALTRLKNATLAVLRKENAAELSDAGGQQAVSSQQPGAEGLAAVTLPREQRQQLTERDPCVGELCVALEACLVLGLKPRSTEEQPSWWHVLYASTLIVDEPTLVQSVLSAAFLSEVSTDAGKARCWLKIALNNHTIESSIMMIFSMACEHLIRNNYEEWSLVRCSEGLGLFLELVIALRDVHFAIEVSGDPFHLPEPAEAVEVEPVAAESSSGEMVATITDADIAAAVGVSPSRAGSFLPPPDTEPVLVEIEDAVEVKEPEIQGAVTTIEEDEEEVIQLPSALFPHRLRGIKPWQYVFGVSLASLSKNPYHSRYALIDPLLALPNIVNDCVAILRENPDTPRLFRTTVLSIRLNQLREIVETEGSVPKDLDPQCAGALLLDFLKNLPDSLLTDDKYDAFVAAGQLRDEEASIRNITCLVNDLPVHCQIVLKRSINLMHFLQQPEHSELNGVDIFTASSVLAPVIAFKKDSGSGLLSERQRGRTHSQYQDVRYAAVGAQVVERMIQHYATIFHTVRVQVVDALERLEAKKEVLRMVSHQLKLLPQMNFMSDRQQVNEITRLFRDNLEEGESSAQNLPNNSAAGQAIECSKPDIAAVVENELQSNVINLELDLRGSTAATPPTSATSSGASSPTTSETTELEPVSIWEQFGFNRPTILGNFEKGGVLMLRAILYWLKNDPNTLALLKMRALPSELPSYDAGLVASSICEALVKLLKLFLTPKHPEIDIVALSLEPFWELFDEDMYFNKLFMFMFQVFDQLWSELDPKAASFTRVITETEGIMNELLKKAPVTVNDLRAEWAEIRARRLEEAEDEDEQEQEELVEDEALQAAALSDPSLLTPPLRYSKKKPSFDVKPDDYKSKLMDTSSILTLEHVAYIDHALPITSQLCRWFRIYSIEANGSSLETLLILAQRQSPTLLVVKDAEGNVFGGFASDEWHRAFHYYGTGESFLFSFSNASTAGGFMKYQWSRKNSYFMLCSDESLIMGGGGNFGLFLDSDLSRGTSGACETYNSPPLTTSQEFTCVHVELWGFTTGDKPDIERHRKSVLD